MKTLILHSDKIRLILMVLVIAAMVLIAGAPEAGGGIINAPKLP